MIGQVMNSIFSLQTVFEDGVKIKSMCSYYLSSCEKSRILYLIIKLKVSMNFEQKLYVTDTGVLKPACSGIIPRHNYHDS